MRKRVKLSPRRSRRLFAKRAVRTHSYNLLARPMRGGFRL